MNTLAKTVKDFNDKMPKESHQQKVELAQFVDDGAFWLKSYSVNTAIKRAQHLMTAIEDWSDKWGLTINPNKNPGYNI